MEKTEIIKLVLAELEKTRLVLVQAALDAKAASTGDEAKPENKYDTRGLEASYYAGAQAKRAVELEESVFKLSNLKVRAFQKDDPISIGALVEVSDEDGDKMNLFLLPVGGITVEYNGMTIKAIVTEAPLAKALIGKSSGEDFEFRGKTLSILSVQ
jgi:transcription elongation GreA/GreB family factor